MKRRKILLLFNEVFANGGIQRFNRTLLAALEQLDCDCEVLSLVDTAESRRQWRADGPNLRVRVFAHNRWRFALATMRAIAAGGFADVIVGHVHFLELAVSAHLVSRRRSRLMLVAHGIEVWDRVAGARLRALAEVEATLCVSEYTAQSLRMQAPGIAPERFMIFPNALASSWIEGTGSIEAQSQTGNARYLLSVARLSQGDRTKGIITALEAFAQLADSGLRYVIAGAGDDLPLLREIVRRLDIEARVDFAGAVSDVELVALYRGCEAFVLPSGQEGFGIVYLEAMHFGAPVIAAAAKGAMDVVRDNETGLTVPYGDVVGLAAAMRRMLVDRALRERLRDTARAAVTGDGCFTARAFTRRLGGILGLGSHRAFAGRNLVFVNRYFYPDESATSRMLSDLARQLSRAGVRVTVVTSRQLCEDASAALPRTAQVDGVQIVRVGALNFGRGRLFGRALDYLGFHAAAHRVLRQILEPGDVVVAKTDPPLLSVTVARAARARGALLVNWLQDVFPETATALGLALRPRWLARVLRQLRDASLRAAVCNVVIGARMRERLVFQGIDAPSMRVIPNWAVETAAPKPTEWSTLRVRLGLTGRFVIGYSGNLGRAHEFETLLAAAQALRTEPRFVFVMTGGGAKFAALRSAVQAQGLTNFRFLPLQPAEEVADSLAAADIHLVSLLPALEGLVVPSKYYGVLAAARPVIFIGDAEGEVARELRAADCGLQVNIGEGARLAAELRALDLDRARLARWGENARSAAERLHGVQQALSAWLSLLGALETQPAGAPQSLLVRRVQSGT